MYKDVLKTIEGVGIYPIISFIMFGLFFLGVLVYIFNMNKGLVEEMGSIPLNDEFTKDTSNQLEHEKSI